MEKVFCKDCQHYEETAYLMQAEEHCLYGGYAVQEGYKGDYHAYNDYKLKPAIANRDNKCPYYLSWLYFWKRWLW